MLLLLLPLWSLQLSCTCMIYLPKLCLLTSFRTYPESPKAKKSSAKSVAPKTPKGKAADQDVVMFVPTTLAYLLCSYINNTGPHLLPSVISVKGRRRLPKQPQVTMSSRWYLSMFVTKLSLHWV